MLTMHAPRVWLKAFWGFDPQNDGYLGFTRQGDQERLIREAQGGDLVLIYGAASEHTVLSDRSRALGFLQFEPVAIRDVDRMSDASKRRKVENGWVDRWTFAVPVHRAWKVMRRIEVRHVAPETYIAKRARVIASQGELLNAADTERALRLPVSSVSVFGEPPVSEEETVEYTLADHFRPSRGITPSFGSRESVYEDGQHFLYMLRAEGCVPALLAREPEHLMRKALVKVGFSNSPDRRCDEHNAALPPNSQLRWKLAFKSKAYADGLAAKEAEDRLKAAFDQRFESLGGEFFLGDFEDMVTEFSTTPGAGFLIRAPVVVQRSSRRG